MEDRIWAEIETAGMLSFARFMELALYAPGLGYYAAGARKLGAGGDFVTAPELSELFGQAIARQLAELIEPGCDTVLELGAGTGRLAADLLAQLARMDRLPARYCILEVSADLRARQHATLARIPNALARVCWLDSMPDSMAGIVLANEVLDALPVELVTKQADVIYQRCIAIDPACRELRWATRPATGELLAQASARGLPNDYTTEIHLTAQGLMRSIGDKLERGVALFVDYGFPAREYYHPQRREGTLMCHYRQRAHTDPLLGIGLQDITTHIDFSALAGAAVDAGLKLLGYANQAQFLINCGIVDLLGTLDAADSARYAPACAAVQRLLSPSEMGELFKVIAVGRGIEAPLTGFRSGDRRHTL